MNEPPRIGSLFSGAGGLDMAVEAVFGGHTVWHSEIDTAASKVLAHRWPGVPNLGDITKVDWADVPAVDILCGGFPCQDVSAAGKRAGIRDGTRSGLWAVFADAIDHLRPPIVVIENVRGLLSAAAHRVEPDEATVGDGAGGPVLRAAGAVLGDLADLGYDAQWATVSAASVGAPHRRERVFIVAHRRTVSHPGHDAGCAQQRVEHETQTGGLGQLSGCPAADSGGNGFGRGAERHLEQAAGVEASRRDDADRRFLADGRDNGCGAVNLLPSPNAGLGEHRRDNGQDPEKRRAQGRQVSLADAVCYLPGQRPQLLPTPNASDCTGGGAHPDNREGHSRQLIDYALLAGSTAWGKYAPAIYRWRCVTNRVAPPPTEPNKNGNPRLSAAFSEWMMGWPDGWVTDPTIGISRNDQLRIIGNGVVSIQAVAALRHLLNVAALTA
jgi:DNA (cytosine-5)-methyltransferase 1